MRREPLGLSILRFCIGVLLLGFLGMLYWSSSLVEIRLQQVNKELAEIKQTLKTNTSGFLAPRDTKEPSPQTATLPSKLLDPSLPNLLHEDPFYAHTLPQLLPPNFKPAETLSQATIGRPVDLHPFSNWAEVGSWRALCGLSLASSAVGKYQTLSPGAALKIEERPRAEGSGPEFWIYLRDDIYWQPLSPEMFEGNVSLAPQFLQKHKVTAHDFKFYFDALMNPFLQQPGAIAVRNALDDIESIRVIDDRTLVVRWRMHQFKDDQGKMVPKAKFIAPMRTASLIALPCFVYQYFSDGSKIVPNDSDPDTYRKNSVWAQNFSEHWAKNVIVSCGPWIFEKMSDEGIRFQRNPDHFEPLNPLIEKNAVSFKSSADNMWRAFQIDQLDLLTLAPEQQLEYRNFLQSPLYIQQKEQNNAIKEIEYNDRAYLYIGWNRMRPFFSSAKARIAMTLAIDRERIIRQYLGGKGTQLSGSFSPFSTAYDSSIKPWPFDPNQAKKLLEEEGWRDTDGDGVLDKEINGVRTPFVFRLIYYVKNLTTKNLCEYIATALKDIGVRCELQGVDVTDLSAVFDDKNFDALCMGWTLGTPPEDTRQLWHSEGAKEPGSSNAIGFALPEADAIIEALDYESDLEKRQILYHRFHKILHEDQPYTFLYVPKRTLLYRERVQNVFVPAQRQDLIPGADVESPDSSIFWIKRDTHNPNSNF